VVHLKDGVIKMVGGVGLVFIFVLTLGDDVERDGKLFSSLGL
jgi:Na+-transporting methylmalonyl-CoA/oxaloacetate decarboxylase gamma subunit